MPWLGVEPPGRPSRGTERRAARAPGIPIAREGWPVIGMAAGVLGVVARGRCGGAGIAVALRAAARRSSASASSLLPRPRAACRRPATTWSSRRPTAGCSRSVAEREERFLARAGHARQHLHVAARRAREPQPGARHGRRACSTRPGKFRAAFADKASLDNERNAVVLESGGRRYLVRADRRRCSRGASSAACAPGDRLARGERFGMIMFGSRVDLFLPPDVRAARRASAIACAPERRSSPRSPGVAMSASAGRAIRAAAAPPHPAAAQGRLPPAEPVHHGRALLRLLLDHRDAHRRLPARGDHDPGRAASATCSTAASRGSRARPAASASQYDSLADLVAFGVAPGILVYTLGARARGARWGWLAASLYVTCGALRLARFNVQVGSVEKRHFVGLPIPAAAEVIAATVLLYYYSAARATPNKHILHAARDLRGRRR